MEFSQTHTQSGGMQSVLIFQRSDQWNSISVVLEKSARSVELPRRKIRRIAEIPLV